MRHAMDVVRVGAAAAVLGLGTAVAAAPTATADDDSTSSNTSSSQAASSGVSQHTPERAAKRPARHAPRTRGSSGTDAGAAPREAAESGDDTASAGAADLVRLLAGSEKPHACFARQYFRFTFGRFEDPEIDGCALAQVDDALDEERPMGEALRALALAPSFRRRSFVEPE